MLSTNETHDAVNYQDLEYSNQKRSSQSCLPKTTAFLALLTVVLSAAVLALIIMVHRSQNTQQNSLDTIVSQLQAASQQPAAPLSRYAVALIPPRKYQETRGTCWDFGTMAAVEHQYRLQAVARGLFDKSQYLRLSEQAYGNQIINLCAQSQYHGRCLLPGDRVAFNSTEGGEAILLFSFAKELQRGMLPSSVCPYIPDADNSSCPGINQALTKNPISFTLQSFSTLYDVDSIKAALVAKQYAMPITIPVWTVSYYMPCDDSLFGITGLAECNPQSPLCRPCPPDISTTSPCCVKRSDPFYNMEGEFRQHHALELEAGHVMMLVGFNDDFVTKDGLKGGFIVRNTWRDGVYSFNEFGERKARGSHSIPYFLQQIGEGTEKLLCPNSYNPRNWYSCGAFDGVSLQSQLSNCLNDQTTSTATANLSPLTLVCDARATLCTPHANTVYYNINQTIYGDGLHILCFLSYNNATNNVSEFCLPPTPIDDVATSFVPQAPLQNKEDYCGFYILPYELFALSKATFLSGWVNDYQLQFSDSSFQANSKQFPQYDYSLVSASTMSQQPLPSWANPLPVGPLSLNSVSSVSQKLRQRLRV